MNHGVHGRLTAVLLKVDTIGIKGKREMAGVNAHSYRSFGCYGNLQLCLIPRGHIGIVLNLSNHKTFVEMAFTILKIGRTRNITLI